MTMKAGSGAERLPTYRHTARRLRTRGKRGKTNARHSAPAIVISQPMTAFTPNGASAAGSRNMPAPIMLPTTSAMAIQKPS